MTANTFNKWWSDRINEGMFAHPHYPRLWAIPTEWPGDDGEHAASLANPSTEYAWLFEAAGLLEPAETDEDEI